MELDNVRIALIDKLEVTVISTKLVLTEVCQTPQDLTRFLLSPPPTPHPPVTFFWSQMKDMAKIRLLL